MAINNTTVMEGIEQWQYPIGKFQTPDQLSEQQISDWINSLESFPKRLIKVLRGLSEEQLDVPYRPGGWSIRQLVHHISDSHLHSYIRFKWAMTEENPTIKPYDQDGWADLFDSSSAPIEMSLRQLESTHKKLVYFLRGLTAKELQRTFTHPDGNIRQDLGTNIGRYAWHGNHHLAQIENVRKSKGW